MNLETDWSVVILETEEVINDRLQKAAEETDNMKNNTISY